MTLTDEQIDLFKANGSMIENGDKYYFLPFWFKELDDNKFEVYRLGKLPQDLNESIERCGIRLNDNGTIDFPSTIDESIGKEASK